MGICCETYKKYKHSKRSKAYNPERKVSVSQTQQIKYVSLVSKRKSEEFINNENINPNLNSNQIYHKEDYFSSNFDFSPVSTESNDPKMKVNDNQHEKLENKVKTGIDRGKQEEKFYPLFTREKQVKLLPQKNGQTG